MPDGSIKAGAAAGLRGDTYQGHPDYVDGSYRSFTIFGEAFLNSSAKVSHGDVSVSTPSLRSPKVRFETTTGDIKVNPFYMSPTTKRALDKLDAEERERWRPRLVP